MTNTRTLTLLLGAVLLASCGESANQVIAGPPTGGARVKFFNFGVGAPGVYFFANDNKMAGISTVGFTANSKGVASNGTESTTGTAYGGVSSGGFYSDITPGSTKLASKIAATTDNLLQIASVTQNIESGKAYSFYMSGIYNATGKTVEAFVVEDAFSATVDWTQAYVRFVNAVSNSNPMTLYAKNTTTLAEVPVGAIIAYKGGGAFVAIPNGVYDLGARESGATANKMSRTAVSFTAGRVYTITARGNILTTSTQSLDNTTNR